MITQLSLPRIVCLYRTALLAAVLTAMFTASVTASDTGASIEHFKLFNECRPMSLLIIENTENIGLTRERIQIATESRLRSARLYTAAPDLANGSLNVSVIVFKKGDLCI